VKEEVDEEKDGEEGLRDALVVSLPDAAAGAIGAAA